MKTMVNYKKSTQKERDMFTTFLKKHIAYYGAKLWIQFVDKHHELNPKETLETYLIETDPKKYISNIFPCKPQGNITPGWAFINKEWNVMLENHRKEGE